MFFYKASLERVGGKVPLRLNVVRSDCLYPENLEAERFFLMFEAHRRGEQRTVEIFLYRRDRVLSSARQVLVATLNRFHECTDRKEVPFWNVECREQDDFRKEEGCRRFLLNSENVVHLPTRIRILHNPLATTKHRRCTLFEIF